MKSGSIHIYDHTYPDYNAEFVAEEHITWLEACYAKTTISVSSVIVI